MVVSIDYTKKEAIRTAGGKEERQKLSSGTAGFAICTWADGTEYISDVPNLVLEAKMKPAPAKKKPAAAKSKAKAKAAPPLHDHGSDFEDEPDDVVADDKGEDEAEMGEPAPRKPKKEDSLPLNPPYIHIQTCKSL